MTMNNHHKRRAKFKHDPLCIWWKRSKKNGPIKEKKEETAVETKHWPRRIGLKKG